ncbi:MAG: tetratricopeptide repeat protein [Nitrospinota bacterium]|nr:tetratricopeptide repeat protein [Nitrospinota bacterium]
MSLPLNFGIPYHTLVTAVIIALSTALLAVLYQKFFRKKGINDYPDNWHMPHRQNLHFTGREEQILALHALLHASVKVVIIGMKSEHVSGGIGKSELAIEFAYRCRDEYSLIWWIDAETIFSIETAYMMIARNLGILKKNERDQNSISAAVKDWLSMNGEWLLVFDNMMNEEDLLPYIPSEVKGRILVTTPKSDWKESVAARFSLDVFTPKEAVDFLLEREGNTSEAREAEELSKETGFLPLALEQACAHIKYEKISIAQYLDSFRTRRVEILMSGSPASPNGVVETACDLSFSKLHEEAKQLLFLCAFLHPEDIQFEMIKDGAEHLPEPLRSAAYDILRLRTAAASLTSYSLLYYEENMIIIHRLMQKVIRNRMDAETRKIFAGAAVAIVDKAFTYGEYKQETWEHSDRLIAQALTATSHAVEEEEALGTAIDLINNTGLYFQQTSRCPAARERLELGLALSGKVYGPDNADVAVMHDNLAEVLMKLRDFENAKKHFQRALEIGIKVYGEDHPTTNLYRENVESLTS